MRVFILGHNGMLGHTMTLVAKQAGHEIYISNDRYTGTLNSSLIATVMNTNCNRIINCIGSTSTDNNMMIANALLPHHLATVLRHDQILVHASSDGIFSGDRGNYNINEYPDAIDSYGISKKIGEPKNINSITIRCSIIGLGKKGLLSWFLSSMNPINGYVNHYWNGITTLEWARLALELTPGLYQPACSKSVSKAELLLSFGKIFNHKRPINNVHHYKSLNRTLQPTLIRSPIDNQLKELQEWYQ